MTASTVSGKHSLPQNRCEPQNKVLNMSSILLQLPTDVRKRQGNGVRKRKGVRYETQNHPKRMQQSMDTDDLYQK